LPFGEFLQNHYEHAQWSVTISYSTEKNEVDGTYDTAQSFGVVDYARDGSEPDYVTMIQLFNRFMIDHIVPEASSPSNPLLLRPQRLGKNDPVPSPITQLLGIESTSTSACGSCGTTKDKQGLSHIIDMIYPRQVRRTDHEFDVVLTVLADLLQRDGAT
jgi:hypothetical protein